MWYALKYDLVAIRFRWIWVEKKIKNMYTLNVTQSQSAFAGYGLKRSLYKCTQYHDRVAIRFRWIWVEKKNELKNEIHTHRRNPLSLDMG